jgi:hypothetical protein
MAPIPWVPGAFAGVDRLKPPAGEWLDKLMRLSNFSFTGHYLTHSWQGGFGRSGKQLWKEIFPQLLAQEWGFWFLYLAIPQKLEDPNDYNAKEWRKVSQKPKGQRVDAAKQLGVQHAQLLKQKFLLPLEFEVQGAVVFVDFEDFYGPGQLLPETIAYYNSIFAELRIPGPQNLAVRPGLYARPPSLTDIVASVEENSDLFLYEVDIDDRIPNPRYGSVPFDQRASRIYSPVEENPLRAAAFQDYNGNPDHVGRTALILGRQWKIWEGGQLPSPPSATLGRVPLNQETTWDFNAAMVRDPRYPIALPRIAVLDEIRLRSVFQGPISGTSGPSTPTTRIEQVHSDWPISLPFGDTKDEMLEHEAPLLLLGTASKELMAKNLKANKTIPGIDPEVFTLNKNGNIVIITASPGGNPAGTLKWSSPEPVSNDSTPLRRNRAMAATKSSGSDTLETMIFYVSNDHTLIGLRRSNEADWTAAILLSWDVKVHPFSNIAAVARQRPTNSAGPLVDVYFLDASSQLRVATVAPESWPSADVRTLADDEALLPGTAMAAVSPSADESLLFCIGIDCRLLVSGRTIKGNLKKTDDRLCAHAKMDAFVVSPGIVYVATLTAVNIPCVYVMVKSDQADSDQGDGASWTIRDPWYYPNLPYEQTLADAAARFEPAPGLPTDYNPKILGTEKDSVKRNAKPGYAFNPFGDVRLSKVGADVVMWIAGVGMTATLGLSGDRSVMLFRKVVPPNVPNEVWMRVK